MKEKSDGVVSPVSPLKEAYKEQIKSAPTERGRKLAEGKMESIEKIEKQLTGEKPFSL